NADAAVTALRASGVLNVAQVPLPSGDVYIHTDSRDRNALSSFADLTWPAVFDRTVFFNHQRWERIAIARNTLLRATGFVTGAIAEELAVDPADRSALPRLLTRQDKQTIDDYRGRLFSARDYTRPSVVIDLGGEGRYQDAINLNIQPFRSTTRGQDRRI